ncbi:type II secretion system GspH family protein [bacterium]|nr:type II secretion system GspH family protein [bacterium]
MKWLLNKLYRKEGSFTLIELLVVMVIFAVLAAVAIPSYLSMRNRVREAGTEAEMANITTALELYNADQGNYPATVTWNTDLQKDGYMTAVPLTDKWNNAYVYAAGTDQATYTLTSNGKNKATTKDDIVWTNGQQTSTGAYK